jgi:two-component system sensor histidine kinase BaeS
MVWVTDFQEKEMLKSLWIKFFILLLFISLIAFSAAFILRELMVKDFREYMEGEMEDRVYWVMADLEGTYERYSGWKKDAIVEDAIWALMLGLEIRVKDMEDNLIMDTGTAVNRLSASMRQRIGAISDFKKTEKAEEFNAYPLFLGGNEIGNLDVRFIKPRRENIFVDRSNRFLLLLLLTLGGIAVILSIIFSSKLTSPIKKLAFAANAISEGNLKSRAEVSTNDEIGRLSETFNMMAKSLEIQEGLRKKLISNMAHELRTPLSAVRGEIEGMLDGLIPKDNEQLQSLYEETGRLKKILDGIEELTKAQASALMLKKQSIELKPFLKNITQRFDRLFSDKGITFKFQCNDNLAVNADPDSLSQIVINLIDNSMKATGRGGEVRLSAGKNDTEVYIEVKDTGHGIKHEDIPFIFERFYKVSAGGLGIGLAIVKELVEAHGWRIDVRSEYGKGSSFTVYLPLTTLYNSS